MDAHAIVLNLRELFDEHDRSERIEVSKLLFHSKMVERTSPVQYALEKKTFEPTFKKEGKVVMLMDTSTSKRVLRTRRRRSQ